MNSFQPMWDLIWPWVHFISISVLLLIIVLLSVAYLTYAERKIIAAIQLRVGPNVVGPLGLLQPFADAIKLLHKEIIIPSSAKTFLFIFAPLITFSLSLSAWAVIPWDMRGVISDLNVGLLYLYAVSSLGIYGVILAGWAGNSKYAALGAFRAVAQMVSYELLIGLVFVSVLLCARSLNLSQIVEAQRQLWFIIPLFPMAILFMIAALAETNRAPFDLPEAESELVAGYHVEYSSMPFGLLFLGEYANMILMSALGSVLFLGGWLPPFNVHLLNLIPGSIWFSIKTAGVLFIFIWVRATLPRYRYDQLMRLSWKSLMPFSFIWVVTLAGVMIYFNLFPAKG